jgi:hypothetical protein
LQNLLTAGLAAHLADFRQSIFRHKNRLIRLYRISSP